MEGVYGVFIGYFVELEVRNIYFFEGVWIFGECDGFFVFYKFGDCWDVWVCDNVCFIW